MNVSKRMNCHSVRTQRWVLAGHPTITTPEQIERTLAQRRSLRAGHNSARQGATLQEHGCFARLMSRLAEEELQDGSTRFGSIQRTGSRIAEEDYDRCSWFCWIAGRSIVGAGYHLQQAVEKFFKAYLIRQGWRLQRIARLGRDCLEDAVRNDDMTLEAISRRACEQVI